MIMYLLPSDYVADIFAWSMEFSKWSPVVVCVLFIINSALARTLFPKIDTFDRTRLVLFSWRMVLVGIILFVFFPPVFLVFGFFVYIALLPYEHVRAHTWPIFITQSINQRAAQNIAVISFVGVMCIGTVFSVVLFVEILFSRIAPLFFNRRKLQVN